MTQKHTQGDWKITHKKGELDNAYWIGIERYHTICKVGYGADDEEYGGAETELANARLIAAAPAMYEALKEVSGMYYSSLNSLPDPERKIIENVRKVLHQAEDK